MRQELIDLYLGALEDDAADALRARIRANWNVFTLLSPWG